MVFTHGDFIPFLKLLVFKEGYKVVDLELGSLLIFVFFLFKFIFEVLALLGHLPLDLFMLFLLVSLDFAQLFVLFFELFIFSLHLAQLLF